MCQAIKFSSVHCQSMIRVGDRIGANCAVTHSNLVTSLCILRFKVSWSVSFSFQKEILFLTKKISLDFISHDS